MLKQINRQQFNLYLLLIFRYGLLGPSGCGKTTLLSCIVGRLHLDSGEIKLKGKHISDIGYMPQVMPPYRLIEYYFYFCLVYKYYIRLYF